MSVLHIEGLRAGYGPITALFGIDLTLDAGQTLALIGANGAGKSTLLRAITGLTHPSAGDIHFDGQSLLGRSAHAIARQGIAMVPEGRRLFASLTVQENIEMGGCTGRSGHWTLERVFALFPVLRERRAQLASALSGGQQQMVAIGRALMGNPRLLLCDELSLGLAPIIVRDIYQTMATVAASGVSLVLVEQDIQRAIAASDRFVCLREGSVVLQGTREQADRAQIAQAYFGH